MGSRRGDPLDAMETCPAMGALRQDVFVVVAGDGHDNTDAMPADDGAPAWLQTHVWFSFQADNATVCCLRHRRGEGCLTQGRGEGDLLLPKRTCCWRSSMAWQTLWKRIRSPAAMSGRPPWNRLRRLHLARPTLVRHRLRQVKKRWRLQAAGPRNGGWCTYPAQCNRHRKRARRNARTPCGFNGRGEGC